MPGSPIREPFYDDWPSLFCPHWLPDMETACRAPEQANRYVVRLAAWGDPVSAFRDVCPVMDEHMPGFVDAWEWVASASATWDEANQRIVMEFRCHEVEPGFPASTAEIMADYVDRVLVAEVGDVAFGQTAIIDVFVPD